MDTLLVTVDCLGKSFDFGLPAEAPISEFFSPLLEACGEIPSEGLTPADEWELVRYDGTALSSSSSLRSCGVIDGMRLILKNLGTLEGMMSRPLIGQVHVFPYPPGNTDSEGPRAHWIREDL